jgi:hypothetical protein
VVGELLYMAHRLRRILILGMIAAPLAIAALMVQRSLSF